MSTLSELTALIRKAYLGVDVRDAIADAMDEAAAVCDADAKDAADSAEAAKGYKEDMEAVFQNRNDMTDGQDIDSLMQSGIYNCTAAVAKSITGYPTTSANLLLVFERLVYTTSNVQIVIDHDAKAYLRSYNYYGGWGDWHKFVFTDNDQLPMYDGSLADGTNIDEIAASGIYVLLSGRTYSGTFPTGVSAGYLFTFASSSYNYKLQILFNRSHTTPFFRTYVNGAWIDWVGDTHDRSRKYLAFGTSITYGQTYEGGKSDYVYPVLVGELTGMDVTNAGVQSRGLISDWDSCLADISDREDEYAVVSTFWGGNDTAAYASMNLGSYTDEGTDTICGRWYNYHKTLSEKFQSALVIVITGVPFSSAGKEITYSGKDTSFTKREMNAEIAKMCDFYGWVNIEANWTNKSNVTAMMGSSTSSHPTAEAYKTYGNWLAQKIAGEFANI